VFRLAHARRSLAVAAGAVLWLSTFGHAGARAQDPLPSGADIIARHVAAMGGEAAWKAVKSMHATGTFTLTAQGLSGAFDLQASRPARLRMRITIEGIGRIETGYDGKIGWTLDPVAGPSVLKDRELTELADDAYFDGGLYGPDHIRDFTPVGREQFARKAAYKVKVVLRSGTEQFDFFDVGTGLLLGFEGTRATPMGNVPTTEVLDEYKDFRGVRMPTVLTQRALGFEASIRLASIEFDTVPADAFELPPAIKALIKSRQ